MTYQPGIPTGSLPLNQDYLNLQANFTQINTQFQVDHVPLTSTSGTPPNGYHEAIHLVPVSTTASNPPNNQPINGYTATTGYGQLFDATINDGINTDTAFYFLTGGNRLLQMTRNFVPQTSANGYTFLPGGLILQYGSATSNTASPNASVTFPLPFPANVFSVQLCVLENSNSRRLWHINTLSKTAFTAYVQQDNGNSVANTFYWLAIGK